MKYFKQLAKACIGAAAFRSGYYRRFFRDRAVIALFHSIDDRQAGKPITLSNAAFGQYCAFFRRYFIPVSLEELLERIEAGRDISRRVVITFDDGYRDNLFNAAPILERYGLPASFFITTDFIESQIVPPWDREWGVRSEWLSWDEVRELQSRGFEIGAHTVTHVNLGCTDGDLAEHEIRESGRRLSVELDSPVRSFAYPFGGRDKFSDENRQRVEQAGYRCCVAGYGGLVAPESDRFRLPRVAVTSYDPNPYHWGYYLLAEHASRRVEPAFAGPIAV